MRRLFEHINLFKLKFDYFFMTETVLRTKFDLIPVKYTHGLYTEIPTLEEVADEFFIRNDKPNERVLHSAELFTTLTLKGLLFSYRALDGKFDGSNGIIYAHGVASPHIESLVRDTQPSAYVQYHLEGNIEGEKVHLCASVYGDKVLREDDYNYWFLTDSKRKNLSG